MNVFWLFMIIFDDALENFCNSASKSDEMSFYNIQAMRQWWSEKYALTSYITMTQTSQNDSHRVVAKEWLTLSRDKV